MPITIEAIIEELQKELRKCYNAQEKRSYQTAIRKLRDDHSPAAALRLYAALVQLAQNANGPSPDQQCELMHYQEVCAFLGQYAEQQQTSKKKHREAA